MSPLGEELDVFDKIDFTTLEGVQVWRNKHTLKKFDPNFEGSSRALDSSKLRQPKERLAESTQTQSW